MSVCWSMHLTSLGRPNHRSLSSTAFEAGNPHMRLYESAPHCSYGKNVAFRVLEPGCLFSVG